jgi:hypothetical protein
VDWHIGTHLSRITCAGGVNFRENEVWPSLYDVAVSWLRLQAPIDCIPHPYWIFKVFEHLEMLRIMGKWVHT